MHTKRNDSHDAQTYTQTYTHVKYMGGAGRHSFSLGILAWMIFSFASDFFRNSVAVEMFRWMLSLPMSMSIVLWHSVGRVDSPRHNFMHTETAYTCILLYLYIRIKKKSYIYYVST